MKKGRKRLLLWLALPLLVLLLLLPVGWFALTSDWGTEQVRARVLGLVNADLAGKVEVKSLKMRDGLIVLDDLKLYTPEGELVVEIAHAELQPRLLKLAEKKVVLDRLTIVRPRVYLKNDERGLNLSRAIASKVPGPPSAVKLYVDVAAVKLDDGFFAFAFGPARYAVQAIEINGKATVSLPVLSLVGDLHLGGDVTSPMTDRLSIDVGAKTTKPGDVEMDLFARTSDTHVRGQLWLDPVKLVVTDSEASPRAVRAFVPALKLKVPVQTKGTVSPTAVDASVVAGSARVTAKANFPKVGIIDALELHAVDVNLGQLLEGARPSHLSADLTGRLGSVDLDAFDGAVQGQARWMDDGKALATADLDVVAVKGQIEAKRIEARVPGARLDVKGKGDQKSIAVVGALEVTNLHQVAQAIADFTGGDVLPLSGEGRLQLTSAGPLLHPAISARGGFARLAWDDVVLTGVKLDAQMADLRRPLETRAQLEVARLQVGGTALEGLSADTKTEGKKLTARLGIKALALSNTVEGTVDPDNRGLQLTALTIEYPRQVWALEAPAHVGWTSEGDVKVESIALRSGEQHVAFDLALAQQRLLANLQLLAFDLSRLPAPLVPESLKLVGLVDAKAKVWGTTAKPEAEAAVEWRGGTLMGLQRIAVETRVHYAAERVDGTVTASTTVGDAAVDFALPVVRRPGKGQPVALHLKTGPIDVAAAARAFGPEVPLTGTVTTTLDLDGTLDAPHPVLHAESANLVVQKVALDRVDLKVEPGADGRPVSVLVVTALGGVTDVRATAPMTLPQLLEAYVPAPPRKPKGVDWVATPLDVLVHSQGVDLVRLSPLLGLEAPLKGKVKVAAHVTGSARHPDAEATVSVAGLQDEGKQPLDATLQVNGGRDDVQVALNVLRGPKPMLALTGRLGGPLETLVNDAQLMETGLVADAEVGPLEVTDLLLPVEGEEAPPKGTLKAHLSVKGTAAAPRGSLRGTLDQMKIGKASLGQANLSWDYDARKHTFATTLTSGGKLKAHGELGLDVSVPAIRKGLQVGKAPLTATVSAADFDVSFFSGIHPMVRTLAGTLKLDLAVEGELQNPGFDGAVAWSNGRLGVAGYGEYRDVQLRLRGNPAGYVLDELTANAGAGRVEVTGKAMRAKPGVFTLTSAAKLNKFPIITDDQLLAFATAEVSLDGEASAELIDLRRVAIPAAHIELPELKRKDLQDLERPADIVLVRNGVPLKKKKKPVDPNAPPQAVARTFRVQLDAPRNLWVKSSDVNLELGLSEKFRIEVTDRTLIYGEANVMRGRIDVIGRRFDIQKNSQVRFGGPAAQPYLNVTATHVNEREAVTVFVTVVGRGKDASLKLSSQPPIPDSEILILLATGRRSLKRGGGSSVSGADAASVLGSLAASQLKTMLAKRLPLDVLSIESGEAGIQDAKVEAGIYLSDRVYLGYQLQLGADRAKGENGNSVKFEYQVSKSWSLDATAGDAPAAGAELVWSHDY